VSKETEEKRFRKPWKELSINDVFKILNSILHMQRTILLKI